ncbi:spore germination protein [Clostridium sp. 19966]|uniref:spore germination protein n=1 Tax=Clostridium sp. 19966 TaxID=2768166 RepID=UPI0028DF6870|nr:spore germination protein [Clostridium sp. 19966]MDT8717681.1 spore germination protein [Clostridium sp. 19966]
MKKNFFSYLVKQDNVNENTEAFNLPKENNSIAQQIDKNIENNIKFLKDMLGKSYDVIFRDFNINAGIPIKAFICFIEGLTDKKVSADNVVKALMVDINLLNINIPEGSEEILNILEKDILSVIECREANSFSEIIGGILSGEVCLLVDGCSKGILIDSRENIARAVEKPDTEVTVRGSREGFTETLRVNTALIRRIIKSPNLIFETLNLGSETNTKICIAYIQGIADMKLVDEVKRRLNKINTDSILESGYIEQFIDNNPFSVFSTIGNSERPDKIAAKLLEGRAAIICDGTPFVLSVPYLFIESFQVNEDYYSRPYLVTLIRVARALAFIITLMLPAIYISLETFHQEMIPTVLILTAAAAREGTPFPTFVEVTITEILFLLLRESGIRMPRPIGQTVSFIGALIIGESAVQAGILSAPMVIIGALTAIGSFIIPSLYDSILFFRYLLIILSAMFGFHGIVLGLLFMLIHMCSLRSFGTPFLEPIAPTVSQGLKDSFIRFPLWNIRRNRKDNKK